MSMSTMVGSDALKAFIFHIVMIFLVLRFLWEGEGMYSYPQALGVGGLLKEMPGRPQPRNP